MNCAFLRRHHLSIFLLAEHGVARHVGDETLRLWTKDDCGCTSVCRMKGKRSIEGFFSVPSYALNDDQMYGLNAYVQANPRATVDTQNVCGAATAFVTFGHKDCLCIPYWSQHVWTVYLYVPGSCPAISPFIPPVLQPMFFPHFSSYSDSAPPSPSPLRCP